MTVYNFNLGIGWASSGVEYAQIYRAKMFRNIKQDAKFIFTDMISYENIEHLTKNIGFEDEEVIWMYQYFTDIKISKTTFSKNDFEKTFDKEYVKYEREGKISRYHFEDDRYYTVYHVNDKEDLIDRVEYVSKGLLVRKDYYTYTKLFTEYYTPRDNMAYLYQRRFFNEDGSVAYEEIIDGKDSIFRFKDQIIYSKERFISYFIKQLKLTKDDVIIIDRATGQAQSIMREKGDAKVGTIVHADHFSENATDDNYILWNNYYEYEFSLADEIDFYVTSTDAQTELLKEQFKKYMNIEPKVVTIPVGSLKELKKPKDKRKSRGLITASRLASEKHIDWLVESVAVAKKQLPELTLDIYGSGPEEEKIKKTIEKNNLQDSVLLKGHKDLTDIYSQYEVYVAASTSEGFGLTLLEAVGSGLPIVGFDVRYGNPTFIKDGKTGYLVKKEEEDVIEDIAKALAEKIVKIYKNNDIEKMHVDTYKLAEEYLTERIEKRWKKLLAEVVND